MPPILHKLDLPLEASALEQIVALSTMTLSSTNMWCSSAFPHVVAPPPPPTNQPTPLILPILLTMQGIYQYNVTYEDTCTCLCILNVLTDISIETYPGWPSLTHPYSRSNSRCSLIINFIMPTQCHTTLISSFSCIINSHSLSALTSDYSSTHSSSSHSPCPCSCSRELHVLCNTSMPMHACCSHIQVLWNCLMTLVTFHLLTCDGRDNGI